MTVRWEVHLAAGSKPGRLGLLPERSLQQAPAAEESAHDGALSHAGCLGDLVVAEAFHIGKLHRRAKLGRKLIDGSLDCIGAELIEDGALDVGDALALLIA